MISWDNPCENYVYEAEQKNHINIYPIPSNELLNIEFTKISSGKISISNNLGEIILQSSYHDNNVQINIDELPTGIYYTNLTDEQGSQSFTKVLKQ